MDVNVDDDEDDDGDVFFSGVVENYHKISFDMPGYLVYPHKFLPNVLSNRQTNDRTDIYNFILKYFFYSIELQNSGKKNHSGMSGGNNFMKCGRY